jgi:hypothetical protein
MLDCARRGFAFQWRRKMKTHLISCGILMALFCSLIGSSGFAAEFGTKVVFKKDQALAFPGLVVTYLGERRVANERFPPGFVYYDFRIEGGKETKTVSWTSGTGDIGPAPFQIGGQRYLLELRISDKLGRLKDDELVIRREP